MTDESTDDENKSASVFDVADRWMILILGIILISVVGFFFVYIQKLGLLDFPIAGGHGAAGDKDYNYFRQALEFRERRLIVALTFRTFLTSFGFIVGLVLSVIGGLFVLRKAVAEFSATFDTGDGAAARPVPTESGIERAKGSVVTNSPGIVFMIGGVLVMIITQYVAIPIGAPEVFPDQAYIECSTQAEEEGTCLIAGRSEQQDVDNLSEAVKVVQRIQAACAKDPENENCRDLEGRLEELVFRFNQLAE